MKRNYLIYALLMTVFLSSNVISAQNYFGDFPVKADPKTVGNKLSRRLMETKHQLYFDRGIHYAEVCTWYGALRFAELTNNKDLIKLLRNRFELLFHLEKELLPPPIHVDQNMFGCLPLRFYNITKDKRYLDLGLPMLTLNGNFLPMQTKRSVNGIKRDTPGKLVFGLMICI